MSILAVCAALVVLGAARAGLAQSIERLSEDSADQQASDDSFTATISSGGRFVAFWSFASELVPGGSPLHCDVYLRDRAQRTTERISVGAGGGAADGVCSISPVAMSANGRFVAFSSAASNLVAGDANGVDDVFVRDRHTGRTELASRPHDGGLADSDSYLPALSADGRFVAFQSRASNLTPDAAGEFPNVFVRDLQTGALEMLSFDAGGRRLSSYSGAPSISADGRFVAYELQPLGSEFVQIAVRDRRTGATELVSMDDAGRPVNQTSSTPSISADGRFVAFTSWASDLVPGDSNQTLDVFVHDRATGATERVSTGRGGREADGPSFGPSISANGRFVAFASLASDLVEDDANQHPDVFVHDRWVGSTRAVSLDPDGRLAGGLLAGNRSISADGRFVAFESRSDGLVGDDTNGRDDVFVGDRLAGGALRAAR